MWPTQIGGIAVRSAGWGTDARKAVVRDLSSPTSWLARQQRARMLIGSREPTHHSEPPTSTTHPTSMSLLTLHADGRYQAPRLARSCTDRESQMRTVLSPEPDTSRVPSGLQASAWT